MQSLNRQASESSLISRNTVTILALYTALLLTLNSRAEVTQLDSTVGLTNFAFASYLGTGIYTTSNQTVFVIQMPFEHTIKAKTDTEAGWVLNLPVTFGLLNFKNINIDNVPDLNSVGTLTFLPGIEYQYPVTPDWTLIPFFDYGFARDLSNTANILVVGTGIKSYAEFRHRGNTLTLGNKFLYARERTKDFNIDADYSLIETGLDYKINTDFIFSNRHMQLSLYYINYFYPNNLIFLEQTSNPIRIGTENEIGFTISNLPDFLFFEKPQLGLGIRNGNGVNVYRLVFGMPF